MIAAVFLAWFVSFVWLVYAKSRGERLLALCAFLGLLAMIIWVVVGPIGD